MIALFFPLFLCSFINEKQYLFVLPSDFVTCWLLTFFKNWRDNTSQSKSESYANRGECSKQRGPWYSEWIEGTSFTHIVSYSFFTKHTCQAYCCDILISDVHIFQYQTNTPDIHHVWRSNWKEIVVHNSWYLVLGFWYSVGP